MPLRNIVKNVKDAVTTQVKKAATTQGPVTKAVMGAAKAVAEKNLGIKKKPPQPSKMGMKHAIKKEFKYETKKPRVIRKQLESPPKVRGMAYGMKEDRSKRVSNYVSKAARSK